ncbi:MAG: ATP-binding protein [bacterium]
MIKLSFTQKIMVRFLIILSFMAVLGSVTYLAFIKMEHLANDLNKTLLLDMFLDETVGSHQKWMNDLAHTLLLGQHFEGNLDYCGCNLGRWYYSFEPPNREIKRIYGKIEKPHRILHESATEILTLFNFDYTELEDRIATGKVQHLMWIQAIHKALEEKDVRHWPSFPGQAEAYNFHQLHSVHLVKNMGIEEYAPLLDQAHHKLHKSSGRITTLSGQGRWDEAQRVYTQEFFPASEEFMNYLSELEGVIQWQAERNQRAKKIYITRTVPAMEEVQHLVDKIRSILMTRISTLEEQYQVLARRSKNFIIFSIIFIISLATLYSLLIPPSLTKTVRHLTDFANRIATDGDLSDIITIESQDEIGQLASSFNKMIQALRKSKEELENWGKILEGKVKSRTKELQVAYRQLEMAQVHLVQSSKLASIGELAAGMAHEINNPMTVIINHAELLLDEFKGNEEISEYCQGILMMGQRVSRIIKDLLTFARQDNQVYSFCFIPELIDGVLGLTQKRLEKDGIRIEKEYETDLPLLSVQRSHLEQVFLNLIMNAKDALLEKSERKGNTSDKLLSIEVRKVEGNCPSMIQIIFKDTGTGINPENLERVFDPFFTTKREDKGTGLGLSISYGIIKSHGGNIHLESHEGEFTKFIIELPVNHNLSPTQEIEV